MADEQTQNPVTTEPTTPPVVIDNTTGQPTTTSTTTLLTDPVPAPVEGDPAPAPAPVEGDPAPNEGDPAPAEGDPAPAPLVGAPEGDYTLAVLDAEGQPVELDSALIEGFTPLAREIGLSDAGFTRIAQFVNDTVIPHYDTLREGMVNDAVVAQQQEWRDTAIASVAEDAKLPEKERAFGGDNLDRVKQVSARALDKLFAPDFRTFLDETGLGNHPAMLKAMYTVGRGMQEDSFERGAGGGVAPKTSEEKFYGKK